MFNDLYPIKLYLQAIPNKVSISLSFVANLGIWFWLFWHIQPQESPVFLHYNILFGVDLIGEWWKIVYIPLTGLIILILNSVIGWLIYHKDKFIAYVLNTTTVICHIFLAVSAYLIVFLNI